MRSRRLAVLIALLLLVPASAFAQGLDFGSPDTSLNARRLLPHLICAFYGAVIGAFFSHKLRRFRKWFIVTCVVLYCIYNPVMANLVIFFAAMIGTWWVFRDIRPPLGDEAGKSTAFGSAEWADLMHLAEHNVIGTDGLAFGVYVERRKAFPLHYTGNRHLLTVAPTRSGKGVSSIIPNLLTYDGSVLVIDPKGENAQVTALRRGKGDLARNIKGLGQTVHVVDPWGITGFNASRFNPLDWLSSGGQDVSENAMMLADAIVTPRQGQSYNDPFWDEEAKALLMGLLLYVALDENEEGHRNLGRVRDIITLPDKVPDDVPMESLERVLERMTDSGNPVVRSTGRRTLGKEPKLLGSVLAGLQSHTHFLDSPRIRESLSVSDFKFENLATRMSVYLVLPADRLETFGRWLRLLVQQAITVNCRFGGEKPAKPILFLLDEMPALGRLTMVEQAYGLMAGFGMQLWGIVQDLSQLERIYEKGWETFIGNSGVLQYFGSRDHKTAEYFSKLCGVTTIQKFSLGRTIAKTIGSTYGGQNSSSSQSETTSDSQTVDVVQRHLAFPDELMVLRNQQQLLLMESLNPIKGLRILWYDMPGFKEHGVNMQLKIGAPPVAALPNRAALDGREIVTSARAAASESAEAAEEPPQAAWSEAAAKFVRAMGTYLDKLKQVAPKLVRPAIIGGVALIVLLMGKAIFSGGRGSNPPNAGASHAVTPAPEKSVAAIVPVAPMTPAYSPSPEATQLTPTNPVVPVANVNVPGAVLDDADLAKATPLDLVILRNAVYARHGRPFASYPRLQFYFDRQPWYRRDPSYNIPGDDAARLTPDDRTQLIALDNFESSHPGLMAAEEEALKGLKGPGAPAPQGPGQAERRIDLPSVYTDAEMARATPLELVILRNAVFARHGRPFVKYPGLQAYFDRQPWYRRDPVYTIGRDDDARLTPLDRANLGALNRFEAARPGLIEQETQALRRLEAEARR